MILLRPSEYICLYEVIIGMEGIIRTGDICGNTIR